MKRKPAKKKAAKKAPTKKVKAPSVPAFSRITMSTYQIAREFGMYPHTFTVMANKSDVRAVDDRWTIQDAIKIIYGDKEDAMLRQEVAKAELLERKNRREAGQLVPVEWITPVIEDRFAVFKSELLNDEDIPKKAARRVLKCLSTPDLTEYKAITLVEDEHEDDE